MQEGCPPSTTVEMLPPRLARQLRTVGSERYNMVWEH